MTATSEPRPGDRSRPRRIEPSWVVAIAVLAVLAFLALRFPGPTATLQPNYTDHVRHEYAAWAFLQIGPEIWSDSLRSWDVSARFVHETWASTPHVHPPGSVLLFLPFGAAANLGLLSDGLAHALMVLLFSAAAVVAAVALWRSLKPAYPTTLAAVITVLAGVDLIRWGLNGFLDPLAVLLALIGILLMQSDRPGSAFLFLAIAMSLHFRLWYLTPVAVGAALAHRRVDLKAGTATAILGVSALPLVVLWPHLDALPASPGFYPNPLYGEALAAVFAAGLICLVSVTERRAVPALAVSAAALMFLFNPQWQPWYAIAFLPLLPLVRTVPAQAALTVGWIQLALLTPQGLEISKLFRYLGDALRI